MTFRPLPLMTALTLAALALLLALGQWQFGRFEEKRTLRAAPAVAERFGPILARLDERRLLYGVRGGQAGWRVLTPVLLPAAAGGGAAITQFVDSQFVPGVTAPALAAAPPDPRLEPGAVIAGVRARPAGAAWFTPPADPAGRIFYAFDPAAMRGGLARLQPDLILMPYADGPNPFAPGADPLPPERHFGYALTWWGLAATLAGVYLAFHHRAGRLRFSPGRA